jgi:hypothetical protein
MIIGIDASTSAGAGSSPLPACPCRRAAGENMGYTPIYE